MTQYIYKVVPAPAKGRKVAGVKAPGARFAIGLEEAINSLAAEGWEYLRADILPSEERQGLTSTTTVYRSVLVFRRAAGAEAADPPRADPPLTAEREDTGQGAGPVPALPETPAPGEEVAPAPQEPASARTAPDPAEPAETQDDDALPEDGPDTRRP